MTKFHVEVLALVLWGIGAALAYYKLKRAKSREMAVFWLVVLAFLFGIIVEKCSDLFWKSF